MSPELLITTFIIVASPGTGAIYTLATGLSQGRQASVVAAFGCTLGIIPHVAAAVCGMAVILHTSALAFQIFKYAGVAYLLYMAWNTLLVEGGLKIERERAPRSALHVIAHAILINLLNPKLSIFFLAFLPQFLPAGDRQPLTTMLLISGLFMAMTFLVFGIYGLFAATVRDHIVSRPSVMAWMRRSFAAAFVLLGAKLALAER